MHRVSAGGTVTVERWIFFFLVGKDDVERRARTKVRSQVSKRQLADFFCKINLLLLEFCNFAKFHTLFTNITTKCTTEFNFENDTL